MTTILAIDPGPKQSAMYGKSSVDGLSKYQRYHRRNRHARLAQNKACREGDKKKHASRMRDYRKRRPDIIRRIEYGRKRPPEYREKFNSYCRIWKLKNPDKRLATYQKRRARMIGCVSVKDIQAIRLSQAGKCFYCGIPMDNSGRGHLEHKVPLCRGGKHEVENICFACSTCNLRKGRRTPDEFNFR